MRVDFRALRVSIIAVLASLNCGYTTAYASSTFKGYECTEDCSGHESGYKWAEKQGIDDPNDCGGNSNSFIEGCQAYAEEQQENSSEDEDEDYGDDY